MRDIPAALAGHLDGETTTLCHCWRLLRRDGATFGFTDHDRDIAFGGTTFAAAAALDAAEVTSELGFAVGGGDVSGALASATLTEDDLNGGRFDDASVESWLVNWAAPDERLLLDVFTIGEVRRSGQAFVAELRGLAHRLDEDRGRTFGANCDADLGDGRCGVNLAAPAFRAAAIVIDTDGRLQLTTGTLASYAPGWFTGGRLAFTGGANEGFGVEVKFHRRDGDIAHVGLWQPTPAAIKPGDAFTLTAGCDKRFATCRGKFANAANFRGFPHMPGNDFLVTYARQGEAGFDGGSLFK